MKQISLDLARIGLGFMFLWAFLDKTFGLGFATKPEMSWLNGNSPTSGFLLHATKGPFVDFFHSLAGSGLVDWFFMLGLLGVGISLVFGIAMRLGGFSGMLMVMLMFVAEALPPINNPVLDEHIIYAFLFLFFALQNPFEQRIGLGRWWANTSIAQKLMFLK